MNDAYTDALKLSIENATTCDSLLSIVDRVEDMTTDLASSITDQIAILATLITPPTDLSEVIEYLEALTDNFLGPYNALVQKQIELVALVAELSTLITDKISGLSCDFVSPI